MTPGTPDRPAASAGPSTAVVVLAYGPEPYLVACLRAVLADVPAAGPAPQVVLVDNGCTTDAVQVVASWHHERVRVLHPGTNTGFTGGVRLGVEATDAEVVVLLNSDAIPAPGAVGALVAALDDEVAVVNGLVRLAEDPDTVNSVGNPVHLLGLSWAGGMGEPVAAHRRAADVASASGALMALRRSTWDALGGFPDAYFAYLEDMELSWRAWQRGWRVRYVPDAEVVHHYEFSRSPLKMYLVDRNRLLFLLTCHERRTLLLLAPALLAFDLALAVVAVGQGWAGSWVRARRWVLTHPAWVRERRRLVQAQRTVPDRALVDLLTDRFSPAQFGLGPVAGLLQGVMHAYWVLVRRWV